MRKVIIGVGIVIVVLVAALLIFAATFDVNKYRGTIQTELEKRLGRNVALGDMRLSVFPPRFRVQNLAIADDPAFNNDAPFVKAQELDVSVRLLPLFHKQVEVDSLELQRPSVNLIKNSSGIWNFVSLGHPAAGQATPSESHPSGPEHQLHPSHRRRPPLNRQGSNSFR